MTRPRAVLPLPFLWSLVSFHLVNKTTNLLRYRGPEDKLPNGEGGGRLSGDEVRCGAVCGGVAQHPITTRSCLTPVLLRLQVATKPRATLYCTGLSDFSFQVCMRQELPKEKLRALGLQRLMSYWIHMIRFPALLVRGKSIIDGRASC